MLFALLVALVASGALAAIAHGLSVGVVGTSVVYLADPGEANVLTFSPVGNDVVVDDSVPIVPGPGCVQGSDNTIAVCTGPNLTRIDADMGDMSDTVTSAGLIGATLRGGAGDDVMTGSDGNDALFGDAGIETISGGLGDDQIDGGDGDDTLRGQEGRDVMRGGDGVDQIEGDDGNDQIDGGAGADTLNGGFGSDWVDYTSSGVFVVVDLLDAGRDGGTEDGIGDELSDLENIRGSAFGDTLVGNNVPNEIDGGRCGLDRRRSRSRHRQLCASDEHGHSRSQRRQPRWRR